MDTSEQYIKMCEKAEEIQALKKRVVEPSGHGWDYIGNYTDWDGDYVFDDNNEVGLHCAGCNAEYGGRGLESTAIWLPRQDQLQEMVGDSPYNNIQNSMWSILDDLHKYAFTPNIFNEFIPTSMEQLWLAFVMKEKYNKVWNGEDWI